MSVVFKPTRAGDAHGDAHDRGRPRDLDPHRRAHGAAGPGAKLEIDPTVGRPGIVVTVDGSGLPARNGGAAALEPGDHASGCDPVIARGGRFRVPMLVFHNDLIGPRDLIAEPVTAGAFPPVSAPVLVTTPSAIPPQFSVLRFIDLPLVLVFRG